MNTVSGFNEFLQVLKLTIARRGDGSLLLMCWTVILFADRFVSKSFSLWPAYNSALASFWWACNVALNPPGRLLGCCRLGCSICFFDSVFEEVGLDVIGQPFLGDFGQPAAPVEAGEVALHSWML